MQKAIMAVLYHPCELQDENERQKFCPSWFFKREGKLQRKDHHLDVVFAEFKRVLASINSLPFWIFPK